MKFPGFQIIGEIHRGRKCVVYRARQKKSDDRSVVIKTVRNEFPPASDVAALRHEYEILRNLDIDGVVRTHGFELWQNRPALILEDIDGVPLKHIVRSNLDIRTFLPIAIQLASTLGRLHDDNVIHKDINPNNIIVNLALRQLRLIDFSISSLLPMETAKISHPDVMEGTLVYMSPEQTGRINRAIDYRTDLYSLGVTFYEMLTGVLPFYSHDPMEVVHWHIAKKPPDPRRIRPELPEMLAQIILKLMSKTAEERYSSGFGVCADLEICKQQLESSGKIGPFSIAEHDTRERFYIPQKLYGRQAEINEFLAAFQRVSEGACEMFLVSGYAGIGKTSLINEIQKPVLDRKGYFISGKFDQLSRQMPYTAIIQSFQELVELILTESEKGIDSWKKQLLTELGNNAQVIIEVIPELQLILGEQPGVPQLAPAEARNRFNLYFQKFISVFAAKEHPLVWFLDDLQWADSASLKLLHVLTAEIEKHSLLLVGAYRDNEVYENDPLVKNVQELRKGKTVLHEMALSPLDVTSTHELIIDTLSCEREPSYQFANLIHTKTDGNPFFVKAFLKSLYDDGLLYCTREESGKAPESKSGTWQWDMRKISRMKATDNVVDFMSQKISSLPSSTQDVIKLAACIGNRFPLDVLAIVSQQSLQEATTNLLPAMRENLIVRSKEQCSFYHDRIQEAAYSLIPNEQRKEVHLRAGRLLLGTTQNLEDSIFDVVDHLNIAADRIKDQEERIEYARLNLKAGLKAKASAAYRPALNYFHHGKNFLTEDCWASQYKLAFSLHREHAECEYLCGNFDHAMDHFEVLLKKAKTPLAKAEIYDLIMIQHENRANYSEAVKAGRAGLKILGIKLPQSEKDKMAVLENEMRLIKENLGERKIEDLIHLPLLVDPDIEMSMRLLVTIWSSTYITGDNLLTRLISATIVRLSLESGNTEESAYGYVTHAITVGPTHGDYQSAYEWGKLALMVNDHFQDQKRRAKISQQFHAHVNLWRRPLETSMAYAQEATRSGLENGDFAYAGYGTFTGLWNILLVNRDLEQFATDCMSSLALLKKIHMVGAADGQKAILNWARALQGRTSEDLSLSDKSFKESAYLDNYRDNPFYMTLFHGLKLYLSVIFSEFNSALVCIQELRQLAHNIDGTIWTVILNFLRAITLSNLLPDVGNKKRQAWRAELKQYSDYFAVLSENCSENYCHMHFLILAEIARIDDRQDEAMDLYEQAIKSAIDNRFIQHEALANELYARFWMSRRQEKIAKLYLDEAHYAYSSWGATAKARQLERAYPDLLGSGDQGVSIGSISSTSSTESELLDFNTVVKAAQAISGEIDLEQLLRKLMTIVIENAGAQNGYLVLPKDDELIIETTGTVEHDTVSVVPKPVSDVADSSLLPASILNYVKRTHLYLVISDAGKDSRFSNDPYVIQNKPKSILCSPILNQGRLVGILYLENNLTADAFTPKRIEIIQILSTQAAIALENAHLFNDVRAEMGERKRAEETLRAIIVGTSEVTSGDFFRSLVRHLATSLEVRLALVTECAATSKTRVRTLAFFKDGDFKENIEYDLAGTPCELVINGKTACYHDRLDEIFPREAGFKSYVGVPLLDSGGNLLGHLAVFDNRPIDQEERYTSILKIFAARAGAELERKQSEDALRESEERFRSGYEHASIGMAMTAMDGHFLSTNKAFCQMLGYSESELLAKGFFEVTHPNDQIESADYFQRVKGGLIDSFQVEKRYVHNDGHIIWAITTVSVVRDLDGKPWYFFAQIQDITERKRAEQALREALQEVEQLKNQLQAENVYLREEIKSEFNFEEIIGNSRAIRNVIQQVRNVSSTDASVMITGETGTGKELIARAVHNLSKRREGPFIKVNCAALPAGLVESEFFGHEKGAFTGALQRKLGRFELADGGSIFLDEVGDIPLDVQVKLLRVLQEKEFERIGDTETRKVNVRVIAATNIELGHAVKEKRFRPDLFYRLNVFPIAVPPLRQRKEDVPLLVHYFVTKFAGTIGRTITAIDESTMNLLIEYEWPGNIRELSNVIERALILSTSPVLKIEPEVLLTSQIQSVAAPGANALDEIEKNHILKILDQTRWVINGSKGAAQILGLHPNTLRNRMQRLGIRRQRTTVS